MAVSDKQFAGGDKKLFAIHSAAGINTQAPRESIKDEQFSWLENLQPVSDGYFRALYSNGTALYTTTPPRTIVYQYAFNIGGSNYFFVVLDDGTALQVNTANGNTTTITSTANAFYSGTAGTALPQAVQWGQLGIAIASQGVYGYAFWDGTLLYFPGSLSPGIFITNGGSAYSSAPGVSFSGGHGSGATATASISAGSVTGAGITNPGSGYLPGDTVKVTFVGGQTTGSGAALTAVLSALPSGSGGVLTPVFSSPGGGVNKLTSITLTNGGSGYSTFATATWNYSATVGAWQGGNASGAPTINITISGGAITVVGLTNPAVNPHGVWQPAGGNTPTITVTDNGGGFFVSSVTVTSGGSGYSPSTTVTGSGGGSPVTQATFTPVIASGVITSVTVISGGKYGSNTPPTLAATDTAVTATGIVNLMPFGISGTCIEAFQTRAWVGNGAVINFTAPGSPTDFLSADGAGAFSSNDGFLKQQFVALKQSNGFLYLFGDSSINVISNVQTAGTPLVTTFNNQNVTPQIGTPWTNSVIAVQDFVMFANLQGVFKLGGSNVTKISDQLDGIFIAANSAFLADTPVTNPTAALMHINDKTVYMLVVSVSGPLDAGGFRTALVMWDGTHWWVGSQATTFTQVVTQEINSTLRAWGNSTTTLNQLFTTASNGITKLWQTKLWAGEGPHITKQAMRLYTMAIDKSSGGYTFTGTYDYRLEGTAVQTLFFSITNTNLTGSGSIAANVRGNYLGMTLQTTKDDFELLSHQLLYQQQSPLGG